MTDHDFLTAMGIESFLLEDHEGPTGLEPLVEALRIDDRRSDYCEQLEAKIVEQDRTINLLLQRLGPQPPGA